MRKQLGVLLEADASPIGGAWNFDAENCKPYKGKPVPLAPISFARGAWRCFFRSARRGAIPFAALSQTHLNGPKQNQSLLAAHHPVFVRQPKLPDNQNLLPASP
jgi:Deoxyribodipyrimidine photo-lyase-related protein